MTDEYHPFLGMSDGARIWMEKKDSKDSEEIPSTTMKVTNSSRLLGKNSDKGSFLG